MSNRTPSQKFQKHPNAGASLRGMQNGGGLCMADGGEALPTSLRGLYNRAVSAVSNAHQSPAEKRINKEYAPAPEAAWRPPEGTPAPMGSQVVLDRRERIAGLRDGGELPNTGLRGMYNNAVAAVSNFHRSPAEVKVNRSFAPQPAAPVTAPPSPSTAPAGIAAGLDGGGGTTLDRRMAAAGLQDGGDVPGQGTGDKIPAMYEPGEFVVSNDMLDEEPSLRGKLRSLRKDVLADKGMTPEEADAKAASGSTLRASVGGVWDDQRLKPNGVPNGQNQNAVAGVQPADQGRYGAGSVNPGGQSGVAGVPANGVQSPLKAFLPGTSATLSGSGEDFTSSLRDGRYGDAVGHGIKQVATLPFALADDVLGGAARGAYGLMRNPVEDAARTAFSMPPRQVGSAPTPSLRTPVTAPAPAPTQPATPTPSLRDPISTGIPGVNRFDAPGQSPLFTDRATAPAYRPAMSENDPGMRGIQARQDANMQNSLRAQQYNAEVAGAKAINDAQGPKEGFMRAQLRQQREIVDMTNATAQRGQDLDYGVKLRGNQFAAAGQQREQSNWERTFAANRSDKNFEASQAAQKNLTEQIGSMLPPGPDGKPDTNRVAQYATQANALVSQQMQQLRDHLALNPNDKTAASALAGLKERGAAQISQDQLRKLVLGGRAADVASNTHTGSWNPWGSTAVESSTPITSLRRNDSGDYVSDRGDVIPARYIDKSGDTLGWGGKVNRDFDALKVK